jgi:poly-gamma-glutamate capsule biosynthesis protein CapA/YwtB (metallophosphatase superfamily)
MHHMNMLHVLNCMLTPVRRNMRRMNITHVTLVAAHSARTCHMSRVHMNTTCVTSALFGSRGGRMLNTVSRMVFWDSVAAACFT